jgi:predicted GNAT superfamily acetyltransferase
VSEPLAPEGLPAGIRLRRPTPDDHAEVVAAIPPWWGMPASESLTLMLPRLFFQHFTDTSFIAEDDDGLAGFLVGFLSSAQPGVAYIHFVGVRRDRRRTGLAAELYRRFFAQATAAGCHRVEAITGPPNRRSQAFHVAMGFTATGDTEIDGVAAWRDYDGPGQHRVAFARPLP